VFRIRRVLSSIFHSPSSFARSSGVSPRRPDPGFLLLDGFLFHLAFPLPSPPMYVIKYPESWAFQLAGGRPR
jgi:hypothetical protein